MKKTGTVLKKEKGKALVLVIRDSACGDNCAGCGICSKEKTVWLDDVSEVKCGDMVELFLERKNFLLMCFIAYVLPLLIMLSAFIIFYLFIPQRGIADLCCVITVFITLALMLKIKPGKKYSCRIVKKL